MWEELSQDNFYNILFLILLPSTSDKGLILDKFNGVAYNLSRK